MNGTKEEPVVYADLIVEWLDSGYHYLSRQGPQLKPRFARADILRTGESVAHIGCGEISMGTLLAYVVVKSRTKLSRIAILDGSYEVFSIPAKVARDDALSAGLTCDDGRHYYCIILDSASWTKRKNLCDMVVIGGALDTTRMKAGISISVETDEIENVYQSDIRVMACFWVI